MRRAELLDASAYTIGFYLWSGQLAASSHTYLRAAENLRPQIPSDVPRAREDHISRRTLANRAVLNLPLRTRRASRSTRIPGAA